MENVSGKTAFITGGASGIGLGMARAFAAAGMRVVLADIDTKAGATAATTLRGAGAEAVAVELDVSSSASWDQALAQAETTSGPVAVLCNNAGIGQGRFATSQAIGLATMPETLWRLIVEINLTGVFLGVRAVAPRMIAAGAGHIVNTSSMAGWIAPPGLGAYSATKYAVVGMSESLRGELAPHGIGVSVLCPGGVSSNLVANTAARRAAAAIEIDAAPTPPTEHMDPLRVGEFVLAAIRADRMYILTHPEYAELLEERVAAVRAAFGASAQPDYRDPQGLLDRSRNPAYAKAAP